jgi:phosphoribosylformylglycinamidine synthase subunit PurSL
MIYRIEVASQDGQDGLDVAASARAAGVQVQSARARRVFFIDSPEPESRVKELALPLLADPVVERAALVVGVDAAPGRLEIHLKPGVMDPVAASTELALREAGLEVAQVRTGRAFDFTPVPAPDVLTRLGSRVLGNAVIEAVHLAPYLPTSFPTPRPADNTPRHVSITNLNDEQLQALSRTGHLFLNLVEMRAIQQYYRDQRREPSDIELETLAQTWSEHCVHKTLKSAVDVESADGPPRHYDNLIKETIFASTQQLMRDGLSEFCLSVFKDNAGVVAFDDEYAVCIKVETHNRPSAIDPYGGSATGVGGCIRDVMGTGRAAKPIANTDFFCVAFPDAWGSGGDGRKPLPPGVLHPRTVLTRVVEGVRDYGNRMGIPTVGGGLFFDDRYVANPLVFAGCVGLIPRKRIAKAAAAGDFVVVLGGRTGRDGIHGATFSSAELTSTHADEFSHAVQIGNAITQKKLLDVVLAAAERDLFSCITDCGAGGLSSAVGEMGEKLGAEIYLDRVPLKYAGLRYDEIWISEAQERMVVSVPPDSIEALLELSRSEDVEATVIGHFGTPDRTLRLFYSGTQVGNLDMDFLHDGLPMPTRRAVVAPAAKPSRKGWWSGLITDSPGQTLSALLAHPNIASRHFIIRQYDHEVQGMSVVKPLVGPAQRGHSDGAVLRPLPHSPRGVALGCGMAPWEADPYHMALLAIDEAIRNIVALGADPARAAILDNFCWPGTDNEAAMGDLVRTAEACRDAALAYRIPFISGKDSLHNQYTDKATGQVTRIPNTLLVSALGIVPDVARAMTMDLKAPGRVLAMIEPAENLQSPLAQRLAVHQAVHRLIRDGVVSACHDVSDGGWLPALAEMALAANLGARLDKLPEPFTQRVASYIVELTAAAPKLPDGVVLRPLGTTTADPILFIPDDTTIPLATLLAQWTAPLDW